MGEVVIEFDNHPLTLGTPTGGDYLTRFLAAASHRAAVQLAETSADGLRQAYRVIPGRRFSDGSHVQARHVLRAVRAALRIPAWQRFLTCVSGVRSQEDVLEIQLNEPASHLPALLATTDFAPIPPSPELGSGAYLPARRTSDASYELTPVSPDTAALRIVVIRDPDGAPERFEDGRVDITCSTSFPLRRLGQLRRHPAYRSALAGIQVRLEPVPGARAPVHEAAFRRLVSAAIERTPICAELAHGVDTATPWPAPVHDRRTARGTQLVIGYHEYFPNREIAENVARQLKSNAGIVVDVVPQDYATGDATGADFLLALRCAAFDHPYAYFEHYDPLSCDVGMRACLNELRWGTSTADTVRRLRARLADVVPVIPLVELTGHWLCRDGITGFAWPSASSVTFNPVRWK